MARLVISSSFSVNMLTKDDIILRFKRLTLHEARELISLMKSSDIVSVVGHEGTAKVLSKLLGIEVMVNRVEYKYKEGDIILVFTVPFRLPEGKVLSNEEILQIADKLNIYAVFPAPP